MEDTTLGAGKVYLCTVRLVVIDKALKAFNDGLNDKVRYDVFCKEIDYLQGLRR